MRRFTILVSIYLAACLVLAAAIVIRGDGPHPRVIALYPPTGDRYWPGGIAEIVFSQPMNHISVQRALQVSIPGQGQEVWFGNTLNLQPLGDWLNNRVYRVRLVGSVTDTLGRPLRTPVSTWFRVHFVQRVIRCRVQGAANVCEPSAGGPRPLTRTRYGVGDFALSPDRTLLAYTAADAHGVFHLHVEQVDGRGDRRLTHGSAFSDSAPFWGVGDTASISYYRRAVLATSPRLRLGARHLWNVNTDGSDNGPL